MPLEGAKPAIGRINARSVVPESRIEVLVPTYLRGAVTRALLATHPYEAPAYHFVETLNPWEDVGAGMIGKLAAPMAKADFLAHVKEAFDCGGIRYADCPGEVIETVAWCGGSGSFLTKAALRAGADAFVTGDITYHKFFDNEDRMLLLDIGHYESEQYTSELIYGFVKENFVNFAVHLSDIKTNPVKYF